MDATNRGNHYFANKKKSGPRESDRISKLLLQEAYSKLCAASFRATFSILSLAKAGTPFS